MVRLVVAVCFSSGVAFAQAPGETPVGVAQPPVAEPAGEPPKAVWVAYMWSLGVTTVPLTAGMMLMPSSEEGRRADIAGGMMVVAAVLGPSAGHWYAGEYITPGLIIRTASAATIAGLVMWDPHADYGLTIPTVSSPRTRLSVAWSGTS